MALVGGAKKAALRWFEDETLFSLCSRLHAFMGAVHDTDTSRDLFGSKHGGAAHDFPSSLDDFAARNDECWGDADSLIKQHTIAPFFSPFQSTTNAQRLIEAMRGRNLGGIKYRLGLVTGRFGAHHPLKACPECMMSDARAHGVPHWRLSHQYPGVLVCPAHGHLLREVPAKHAWSGRYSWVLPCKDLLPQFDHSALTTGAQGELHAMASSAIQLAALGFSRTLEPILVSEVYKEQIRKVSAGLSDLPTQSIIEEFLAFAAQLRPFRPYQGLPDSAAAARSFLCPLLRPPRGHSHPLKHLVLITWLFGDFTNFLGAYDEINISARKPANSDISTAVSNKSQNTDTSLQRRGALRPKVLKPAIRCQLTNLLMQGAQKAELCSQFGITVSTINKLLRSDPSLQAAWRSCQHKQNRAEHRETWLRLSMESPNDNPKALRLRDPRTYAWLYRNDRVWLLECTSAQPTGRAGNNSCIDWEARDIALEALVRRTIKAAFGQEEGIQLTRNQMFSLLPSLPAALTRTDHYSATRAYLKKIIGKQKSNAPSKISHAKIRLDINDGGFISLGKL